MLQTSHLDEQVQIYDTRHRLFDRAPSAMFGYRDTVTSKLVRSKYRKGASQHSYFARGFQDGTVVVWDYRKIKVSGIAISHVNPHSCEQTPLLTFKRQLSGPVWHTLFLEGSRTLVSYGENSVAFLDLVNERNNIAVV